MKPRDNIIGIVRFYDTRLCKVISCTLSFLMLTLSLVPNLQAAQMNTRIKEETAQSGQMRLLSDREMEGISGGDITDQGEGSDNGAIVLSAPQSAAGGVQASGGQIFKGILGGFNVDQNSGAATMRVPLTVPEGKGFAKPEVAVTYRSGAEESWCGVGWNLDMGYILRMSSNKKVPEYTTSDKFFYVTNGGSMELENVSGTNEWHATVENAFLKFVRVPDATGLVGSWEIYDKNGTKYYFGTSAGSRTDGYHEGSMVVYKWHLDKVEDINGNIMTISYEKSADLNNFEIYLKEISYNNNNCKVIFNKEGPVHANSRHSAGFYDRRLKTTQRLKSIEVKAKNILQREYVFHYSYSTNTKRSLLDSISTYDKNGSTSGSKLPAIKFDYKSPLNACNSVIPLTPALPSVPTTIQEVCKQHHYSAKYYTGIDVNGDGITDIVKSVSPKVVNYNGSPYTIPGDNGLKLFLSNGSTFTEYTIYGSGTTNDSLGNYAFGDFDGDGKTEVLVRKYSGGIGYMHVGKYNVATHQLDIVCWNNTNEYRPEYTTTGDFNGDGKTDVVRDDWDGTNGDEGLVVFLSTGSSFTVGSYWFYISGGGVGLDCFQFGDFTGDGKTDIAYCPPNHADYKLEFYKSTGSTFSAYYVSNVQGPFYKDGAINFWTGDFNGDGICDMIRCIQGTDINMMWGLMGKVNGLDGWIWHNHGWSMTYYRPVDCNADGRSDLMRFVNEPDGDLQEGQNYLKMFRSSADSFVSYNWYTSPSNIKNCQNIGDINGDGVGDILQYVPGSDTYIKLLCNVTGVPDLLTSIIGPEGGQIYITYKPSTQYNNKQLPFVIQTVGAVTMKDGITLSDGGVHSYTTNYSYDNGLYDLTDREFRGFGSCKTYRTVGTVTDSSRTYFSQSEITQGRVDSTKSWRNDILLAKTITEWEVSDSWEIIGSNNYPRIKKVDNYIYGTESKRTEASYEYDDYGNITKVSNLGEVDPISGGNIGTDETYETTEYIINTGKWIFKPKHTFTKNFDNTVTLSETKYYYDKATSIETIPVKGLVTKIEKWLDIPKPITSPSTRDAWATVEYTYYETADGVNLCGNLKSVKDAFSNTTTYNYDPSGCFIISKTNALYQTEYTTYYGVNQTTTYNGLYGQIESQKDPNNTILYKSYDNFGRPYKIWSNGSGESESSPNILYEYHYWWEITGLTSVSSSVVKFTRKDATNYYKEVSFYDGMGRSIQSWKEADSKYTPLCSTTLYDNWGKLFKTCLPVASLNTLLEYKYIITSSTAKWITSEYDGLGRVVKVTNPDWTYKTVAYDGMKTTKTDENGKSKIYHADVYGRLIKVTEKNGTSEYYTNYEYTPAGNLKTITKADGQQIKFYYDSFGRKIKSEDPDRGTWQFEYDLAGNLVKQKDARDLETDFVYDELNRIKTKTNGAGSVSYTYDAYSVSPENCGIGRLSMVVDPSETVVFTYNKKGQLSKEQRQIMVGGTWKNYMVERRYNTAGQLDTLIYPDGERVPYRYDKNGQLASVATYASDLSYNNNGQMTGSKYGNGLISGYVYNDKRLWLDQIKFGTAANPISVLNLTYGYDFVGNVTNVNNLTNTLYWTFEYDDLYRLKKEVCRNFILAEEFSDVLLQTFYANNYAYDGSLGAVGNRTSLNGQAYSYISGTNQLQFDGSKTYGYDDNGNMVSSNNGVAITNYTYNADNRLSQVSYPYNTVDYTYNSVGLRVKKTTTNMSSGQVADAVALIEEPYNDLVTLAPTGDGHDDARDLGKIKVHSNNNYIFFEIDHKYLYGTNQGEYENLYIAIDTDHIMGSGNMFFPDNSYTGIEAANAWEYCVYLYNEDNYGIYQQNLTQLEKPSAGGMKMKVNYIPSANGKVKIQIPLELLGSPKDIRFVIMTTMPGTVNTGTSIACDVAPGGMNSIVGGIVYGAEDYVVYMPGNYTKTVTSEYYLYDESGHVLCEIDGNGYLKTKNYYMNGQLLARSNIIGTTPADGTPLNDGLESTTYCKNASGDGSAPSTFTLDADHVQGTYSIKTVTSTSTTWGNFSLVDQNVNWNAQDYRYIHIWVKPTTGTEWITFHAYDRTTSQWRDMLNYTDADVRFYVGKDLKINQWNELWIDLYKNNKNLTIGLVSSFSMHCNGGATIYWDHFYTTTNSGYDLAYYHNDLLGSPRAMSNVWGEVVWRQDYKAFGQDFDYSASGNAYKYNGKPLDANIGLYYYGARYYNPEVGRFVSCDPVMGQIENPQTFNPYPYCANNPQTYIDPNGEFFWIPILIGAGIGALAGGGVAYAAGYRPNQWQFWAFVGGGALLGGVGGYFYSSGFTFSIMAGDKAIFSYSWQGIGSTGGAAGLAGGGTSGAAAIATASLTNGINGDYLTESMLLDIGYKPGNNFNVTEETWYNPLTSEEYTLNDGFGYRFHPKTGKWSMHYGVDMTAAYGTPIYASKGGTVTWAGSRGTYGNLIELTHDGGFTTRYAHTSFIAVDLGWIVCRGVLIGFVGSTGRSTGNHLHFEIRYLGVAVDPLEYVDLR
jgi:RHS repeat-associated protein